jgi:heme exporter protein D
MSFGSVSEFLAMGGHGLYVWLSYGAASIIVLYNVISVQVRQRRYFRQAWDLERRATARAARSPGAEQDAISPAAAEAADAIDRGESVRP